MDEYAARHSHAHCIFLVIYTKDLNLYNEEKLCLEAGLRLPSFVSSPNIWVIVMEQPTEKTLLLKHPSSERFHAVAAEEITQSKKPYVPDNIRHSSDWAVRTFEQWRYFYNSKSAQSVAHCMLLGTRRASSTE